MHLIPMTPKYRMRVMSKAFRKKLRNTTVYLNEDCFTPSDLFLNSSCRNESSVIPKLCMLHAAVATYFIDNFFVDEKKKENCRCKEITMSIFFHRQIYFFHRQLFFFSSTIAFFHRQT